MNQAITKREDETTQFALNYTYETDNNYRFIRKGSEKDPVILTDRDFGSVLEERQNSYEEAMRNPHSRQGVQRPPNFCVDEDGNIDPDTSPG